MENAQKLSWHAQTPNLFERQNQGDDSDAVPEMNIAKSNSCV